MIRNSLRRSTTTLFSLALIVLAPQAAAEFNHSYPRTRFFSELTHDFGRETSIPGARSVGRTGRETKFNEDGEPVYDTQRFRAGAVAGYSSQHAWRDFLLSDSGAVFAGELYGSFYGVEASVGATFDAGDELEEDNPYQIDYRLSYSFIALTSYNTIAIAYHDLSAIEDKIGTAAQGFGNNPQNFESSFLEASASSYWFNDTLQVNGANYFLGFDAWVNLTDIGARGQIIAGVLGANTGGEVWMPNGARLQGALIYQWEYFRSDSNFPGGSLYGEVYWDLEGYGQPFLITAAIEYFAQIDEKARDRLTWFVKFEFKI